LSDFILDDKHGGNYNNHRNLKWLTNIFIA